MTIEEIEKEWAEWSQSEAAKYSGHIQMPAEIWAKKYADKLLAVAKVAKVIENDMKEEYPFDRITMAREEELEKALKELEE